MFSEQDLRQALRGEANTRPADSYSLSAVLAEARRHRHIARRRRAWVITILWIGASCVALVWAASRGTGPHL